MRIVDVRAKTVRVETNMFNARGSRVNSAATVVAAITDVIRNGKPVIGFSFSATGFQPPTHQLNERFIPKLLQMGEEELAIDPRYFDPAATLKALKKNEKLGGDGERATAIGTLECAVWDVVAKLAQVPVYRLAADRYRGGRVADKVECYVGGGWYSPDKNVKDLSDEVQKYLDMGYRTVKIKVGGAPLVDDLKRVDAALAVVGDPARLAVDANSGIAPGRLPEFAQALKNYGLRWFEEPVHPNDYQANAEFIAMYGNPVATGENQFSFEELRNLARYGGMRPGTDILQWDIPHAYGMHEAANIVRMLAEFGWSTASMVPHGGNQISLNASAAFGFGACESYPDVFGVLSGYADDLEVVDGHIAIGQWEGFGFEGQAALFAKMRELVPEYD
ncbi:MAG: enolase C-terminal domain-like protein [Pigmentiphaga sp.]|uniref:enolase C-terminal domain-like protein n=1 Tax=Pigmentiphaga sp. TaxID=1977564 RepID=UPI0029AE8E38|nr:enolase C-terminal domain-like protein [Pigmentiphaga sp.]MDX3907434.1 enolase C-terminal domain-like protein [Pigmentiphaga sp.]